MSTPILSLRGLTTSYPGKSGPVAVISDVDIDIGQGETVGIVGESGSGKSVTFLSALGLLRAPGKVTAGSVMLDGVDMRAASEGQARRMRGRVVALAMQDALSALNPSFTIGQQIIEVFHAHHITGSKSELRARAAGLLGQVGIPAPETRLDDYPHQFSGGMRQRAMIATALAAEPKLLVADEPTTALDVSIRAQVLNLLSRLQATRGMAVAMITHDLAVVAERCARVVVMYAGQVVETGPTAEVIAAPAHPYTKGLIDCLPLIEDPDRDITPIAGQMPDLARISEGCRFQERCAFASDLCRKPQVLRPIAAGRQVRCHLAGEYA